MKKTLLALLAVFCAVAASADPFDDFQSRVRPELVKPFALDVGGILGGASNPALKPLGFPGFTVGVNGAIQFRPDRDDLIMRNSGVNAFGLGFVEAGVGLPFGLEVLAHGTKVGDFTVFGGGLRANVFKAGTVTMALPSVSLSAFYDKVDHDFFDGHHVAGNAAAVWNQLPIVHPFAQVGVDSTKIEVSDSATLATARGVSATATAYRMEAGLDISPLPLLHIFGSFALRHNLPGANFGLSFTF